MRSASGTGWPRSSPRWACACHRRRRRSRTSTRAWTSSAGVSSATGRRAPIGTTSTPIRPRRRSRRSRTRCGKCADRTPTLSLEVLLHRLNRVLRGWTAYFRFGVSHATFRYLRHFVWQRVIKWLRRKFRRSTWKELRRRYCGCGLRVRRRLRSRSPPRPPPAGGPSQMRCGCSTPRG
ncbi:group II intron maturase-specific domain-containing protein [Streptomyces sp. NPDC127044]